MSDSRRAAWKRTERAVARQLGGRRVPVTGRARGDVPDVEHDLLAIEVKHWARLPTRVVQALEQAEAAARSEQLPVAVIHGAGERMDKALVVMRLEDFRLWGLKAIVKNKKTEPVNSQLAPERREAVMRVVNAADSLYEHLRACKKCPGLAYFRSDALPAGACDEAERLWAQYKSAMEEYYSTVNQ